MRLLRSLAQIFAEVDRSLSVGLINGGFAGLFWMFIATSVGYSTVVASLSEMESM